MLKRRGKSLYEVVKGIGRIAECRHTAISVYTNRAATERHWMPEGSDCPYPEVLYSDLHDATTLERYQLITRSCKNSERLINCRPFPLRFF